MQADKHGSSPVGRTRSQPRPRRSKPRWQAGARNETQIPQKPQSPALIADGNHARADAYVSLAVVGSALAVALGAQILDPLIGLAISAVILRITRESWRTLRADRSDGPAPVVSS